MKSECEVAEGGRSRVGAENDHTMKRYPRGKLEGIVPAAPSSAPT